tara:strand:- start:9155 stop:9883 length:729 start_codon:yes stop_codon:yes gene_type:complete
VTIAILGLRSGSKGIPDKNIKHLHNKPLFYWILRTIFASKVYDDVIVSSDSSVYLSLVGEFFPNVFLHHRSTRNSTDVSVEYDFILEALDYFDLHSRLIMSDEIISRFHATSPLQSVSDIKESVDALVGDLSATSSVLIRPSPIHPHKTLVLQSHSDSTIALCSSSLTCEAVTPRNRQTLAPHYIRSNIINFKKSTLDSRSLTGHKCLAVLSDSDIHVDIDSPLDFMFADYIIRNNIKDLLS